MFVVPGAEPGKVCYLPTIRARSDRQKRRAQLAPAGPGGPIPSTGSHRAGGAGASPQYQLPVKMNEVYAGLLRAGSAALEERVPRPRETFAGCPEGSAGLSGRRRRTPLGRAVSTTQAPHDLRCHHDAGGARRRGKMALPQSARVHHSIVASSQGEPASEVAAEPCASSPPTEGMTFGARAKHADPRGARIGPGSRPRIMGPIEQLAARISVPKRPCRGR